MVPGNRFLNASLAIWFLTIAVLAGVANWYQAVVFFLVTSVLPGLVLLIFLIGMPVMALVAIIRAIRIGRARQAILPALMVLSGLAAPSTGTLAVDHFMIMRLADDLAAAPAASTGEAADPATRDVVGTKQAAFARVETFFLQVTGLAYDRGGRLAETLDRPPESRDPAFLASAPTLFSCPAKVTPLGGSYYRIVFSAGEC